MQLPWPLSASLFWEHGFLHRSLEGSSEKLRTETLQMLSGGGVASKLVQPYSSTEMSVTWQAQHMPQNYICDKVTASFTILISLYFSD